MITSMVALALMSGGLQESAATPAQPAAPERERRICRVLENTGSILPRRVCRPASHWTAIDAEQSRITERDNQHLRDHARSSMREF